MRSRYSAYATKNADYIIDLGPEGGEKGGEVICCGTPEEIAAAGSSYTGSYLEPFLRSVSLKSDKYN